MPTLVREVALSPGVRRLRLRRKIRRFVTFVVTVLLAVASVFGVLMLVVVLREGFEDDAILLLGLILAPIVLWFIARKLRSARRPRILYLRGFERIGTEEVVTLAATGAMGRHYRLVTLDDSKLSPVGVPRRARMRAWLTVLIGVGVIGASLYFGLQWAEQVMGGAVDQGFQAGLDSAGDGIGEAIAGVVGGFVLALVFGIVLGSLALVVVVLLAALGAQIGLSSLFAVVSMHRAESRKRFTIDTTDDLVAFRVRLDRSLRKRWAPRLLVVRVSDNLWKEVVTEVGTGSVAALMDLSHPSEGLYWEAVHFLKTDPHPCVLVAEEGAFRSWFENGPNQSLTSRFRDLLQNVTVILFSEDKKGQDQFQRSVRDVLDGIYVGGAG